jgi:asparagine synthase (glutamine-hydrolysing)
MCGISGFLDLRYDSSTGDLRNIAMRMADTLRHRGPNDAGAWADPETGIALAMRRLAILDLSPAGRQPMQSASGRYVIVYNGEIYNYQDLRAELSTTNDRYPFRGNSDTEVMLAAFDRWGVEESVKTFNGMFAFAVWDRYERSLTLARDRFGEKPLYYASLGHRFIFGSELKALRAHPAFLPEVDLASVALFLRYGCIPSSYSIYQNVLKLPPASLLKISAHHFDSTPQPYWSLAELVTDALSDPLHCSEQDAVEQLDLLLRDAVRIRMRSDVPLGAFLSGGVDSSTVVSLMQAQSTTCVKTFSIGNHDRELNEAGEASTVARHLGTDHTELYVTSGQALEIIPSLPRVYDEPFSDCSQIPTILVSQLARQHVTVSLSGDGGDELFGGYNRHVWGATLNRRVRSLPHLTRVIAARGIRTMSPGAWDFVFRVCHPFTPVRWRQRMPGYKLYKIASILESRDVHSLYEKLTSHWLDSSDILSAAPACAKLSPHNVDQRFRHVAEDMMYLDTIGYLPSDILAKLDRSTMSVGLEGRVPMLDPRVAYFAWRLPLHLRIRGRQGKWILRQVLYRYVPPQIVDRPKSGFGVPLAAWLRGPLRHWAESLLSDTRLRQEGYFSVTPVLKMWHEHLSGKASWEYHLWDILMFQAWLDESRTPGNHSSSFEQASTAALESA